MVSKFHSYLFELLPSYASALVIALLLSGCGIGVPGSDKSNDNIIGEKLGSATAMSDRTAATDRTEIAMFDPTTRMIHQFDLAQMKISRSIACENTKSAHSVLFDQPMGLVIDFSDGHVSMTDRFGRKSIDPIMMAGRAKSAAFNPTRGVLVVYDDMSSIALVKFGYDGQVLNTWTGGPVISTNQSMRAGDLIDDGTLVLGLDDGKLVKVNVDTAIQNRAWGTVTPLLTGIGPVSWLAPVRGFNDRILAVTSTTVALISLVDGSTIDQRTISSDETINLKSKKTDPHVILKDRTGNTTVVYTDGATILTRSTRADAPDVFTSRLSLLENSWTIVSAKTRTVWTIGGSRTEYYERTLKKFRLSDMLGSRKIEIANEPEIDVSSRFVFALYPDELGHGVRISIDDQSEAPINGFNAPYIK